MPTYSYRCADCGHAFDIQQAFTDDALTTCPNCGGPLRKQYGTVGVTFNGSGFYRTDSRKAPASGGDSGSSSGSGGSGSSGGSDGGAASSSSGSGSSTSSGSGASGGSSTSGGSGAKAGTSS